VPEKSNIWRDCVDGMYDWVKEHIAEARRRRASASQRRSRYAWLMRRWPQGAPLNESDHCGDPPLLLAAGNGARRGGGHGALAARQWS